MRTRLSCCRVCNARNILNWKEAKALFNTTKARLVVFLRGGEGGKERGREREISQNGFWGAVCSSLVIRKSIADRVRDFGSGHLRACLYLWSWITLWQIQSLCLPGCHFSSHLFGPLSYLNCKLLHLATMYCCRCCADRFHSFFGLFVKHWCMNILFFFDLVCYFFQYGRIKHKYSNFTGTFQNSQQVTPS